APWSISFRPSDLVRKMLSPSGPGFPGPVPSPAAPALVARELRLPLLEEGGHSLLHVLRRRDEREEVRLEPFPLLERDVEPARDRLEGAAHGDRAAGEDRLEEPLRLGEEGGGLEDPVDDAHPVRLGGRDRLAGEDPLPRDGRARDPREAL